MNNVFNIKNCQLKDLNQLEISLEEYGILSYILIENPSLEQLLEYFNIDIELFREIIKELVNKKIMNLNIINLLSEVSWELDFTQKTYSNEVDFSSSKFEKIAKIFYLNKEQIDVLKTIEDDQILLSRIYNIRRDNIAEKAYSDINVLKINNIKDYKKYLNSSSPFLILSFLKNKSTYQDFELFYTILIIQNYNLGLINFLIEYSINTSVYNNFSHNFFKKVLNNWSAHDLQTVDDAMKFIQEIEKKQTKGNYKDPNWNEKIVKNNGVEKDNIKSWLKENDLK